MIACTSVVTANREESGDSTWVQKGLIRSRNRDNQPFIKSPTERGIKGKVDTDDPQCRRLRDTIDHSEWVSPIPVSLDREQRVFAVQPEARADG